MAVSFDKFMTLAMWLRLVVILLYSASATIMLYAMCRARTYYHLLGAVVWCVNVVAFTFAAMMRSLCAIDISVEFLNTWSSIVRIHGGIVILTMSIYYLYRRLP